jgi:hypothetical protein
MAYSGSLVTDTKEGFGKLRLSNGEVFEGEFKYDKIDGKGRFYTLGGGVVSGLWKENKLVSLDE